MIVTVPLLRRKAALVQSEMEGAEQADQEVAAWRVGSSHGGPD